MRISILCSSRQHPIYPRLQQWRQRQSSHHEIELVEKSNSLAVEGGDILFLISCNEIVSSEIRGRFRVCLVIHASDLPQGRGWSPLVWQILEGKNTITVTLLEAEESVDSGVIWQKTEINFDGHELCDEINAALFEAEFGLMDFALENIGEIKPTEQVGAASYYPRRTPDDSRLDTARSIAEQFNLLRVADNERYPAFFDHKGHRYQVLIKKMDSHEP